MTNDATGGISPVQVKNRARDDEGYFAFALGLAGAGLRLFSIEMMYWVRASKLACMASIAVKMDSISDCFIVSTTCCAR